MDKIQFRRDTLARWAAANPILAEGEIGYVTDDPNRYKMGDGVKTWDQLPFRGFDGNIVHEAGESETAVMSQKGVTDSLAELESKVVIFDRKAISNYPGYDYSSEVSELYIMADLPKPAFWVLEDCTPILWFENNLGCRFNFGEHPSVTRENGVAYPLIVYHNGTETYPGGTILGYVVFNDIYGAAKHSQGSYIPNVNANYCRELKNSPIISSMLGKSLADNSVTTNKIADNSITDAKIANEAVGVSNLKKEVTGLWNTFVPLDSYTDYSLAVSELLILDQENLSKRVTGVGFWMYADIATLWFVGENGDLFGCRYQGVSQNNVAYPLLVYTNYEEEPLYPLGTVVGYVVFKDVEFAKSHTEGIYKPNINMSYCSIKNCPQIAKQLNFFLNGNSVGEKELKHEVKDALYAFNHDYPTYSDYSKSVSELFIETPQDVSKEIISVGFWMYAYSPILWIRCNNGEIGCKYEPIVTQNGTVYPLKVYHNTTGFDIFGETLGYVVFKDVVLAKESGEGNFVPNVNYDYISNIKNAPNIAKSIGFYGESSYEYIPNLRLPKKVYAVVGDTLQLYYRAILDAWDISGYKIRCICDVGKSYPRYFEYTPTAENVGTTPLTVEVINQAGKVITSSNTILHTVSKAKSPSSQKNIFIFGDSLTSGGQWVREMHRRLVEEGGSPNADDLSNIRFCGSMKSGNANFFGVGGWSWTDYITKGRAGFRFFVTGVSSISIGTNYTNNGHTYTVTEVNVTNGTGNILCNASSFSDTPTASGVLTKVGGTGDSSIAFTSYSPDSQNPLWDDEKNVFTFKPYVDKYGNGQCDVVYTLLTWNSLPQDSLETINERSFENNIKGYVKTFADKLHEEYPNAKLKLIGLQCPSLDGGYTSNYGSGAQTWALDFHGLKCAFYMNKMLQSFANSDGYSDFVEFVDAGFQFDNEYGEQYTMKPVNVRVPGITEKIGTNGVHPSEAGYMMFADAAYRNFVANFCQ